MSLTESELADGRAQAQATMEATVRIEVGGYGDWDPVNGATPGAVDVVYEGPGRVQPSRLNVTARDSGEVNVVQVRPYRVAVPHNVEAPPKDARVKVLAHADPEIEGRTLQVDTTVIGSFAFERVLHCTLTGGGTYVDGR